VAHQVKRDDFTGKRDQSIDFTTNGALKPGRVLLLGLGSSKLTDVDFRVLAAKGARFANGVRAESVAVVVPPGVERAERSAAEGLVLGSYRFTRYFTGDRVPKFGLARGTVVVEGKAGKAARDAVALGQQVGEAICVARDLVNEPPNEMYPEALARVAAEVGKQHGLKVTVFDKAALNKRGMKLIMAVGQGSAREPRLVHMSYAPPGKPKGKLVFVGKGLTFDSGGLCIKPAPGMEEMKGDMGGAANVIALMAAVAAAKPSVEVHGIIGAAENMPDGAAYRPGDIFGSLDGRTVEIINTDAEGRLVLADCLAYARALKPDLIVDNATLTGACVVALGPTRLRRPVSSRAVRVKRVRSSGSSPAPLSSACSVTWTFETGVRSSCEGLERNARRPLSSAAIRSAMPFSSAASSPSSSLRPSSSRAASLPCPRFTAKFRMSWMGRARPRASQALRMAESPTMSASAPRTVTTVVRVCRWRGARVRDMRTIPSSRPSRRMGCTS
jgi:leucyl aminopeptidase